MSRIQCTVTYEDIISIENLLDAWKEFLRGKRRKRDVQWFAARLTDNVLALHRDLADGSYTHGGYHEFKISDPKPRDIHKASVRDRLVHHALYRRLYPFFDRTFISDSYSCRFRKGTHKAMNRFRSFAMLASRNNKLTCWVLQCDIKKCFASIDQHILIDVLRMYIPDTRIMRLIEEILLSFPCGLPLGNLTSQLLVNVYMNEFDQYVKHKLMARYYIRYADDFVILSPRRSELTGILPRIDQFLRLRLNPNLHPGKITIRTIASGVDFLGWVHFPDHRVLRASTKRRLLRNCAGKENGDATVQSYLGLLSHGNAYRLRETIHHAFNPTQTNGGQKPHRT